MIKYCKICKRTFLSYRKDSKFCSRKCMGVSTKHPPNYCKECNVPFQGYRGKKRKNLFCSTKCRSQNMFKDYLTKGYNKFVIRKKKGCWEWSGNKNLAGYGKFGLNYKHILAHRASYTIHIGDIPDNLLVLHKCDNPACTNPTHLFIGSHQDNIADKVRKKRTPSGKNHWKNKRI